MKSKKYIASFLGITAVLFSVVVMGVRPASAAINSNNLGDLVVLGALFGQNDSTGILSNSGNGIDLGNLVVLDQLFGSGTSRAGSLFGTSSSGKSSLGNLIILNQLFNNNNSGLFGQGGTNNLGRLFVLDRLFSGTAGSLFGSTVTPSVSAPARTTTTTTTSTPVTSASPTIHMVSVDPGVYTPPTITINRGDTVQWINRDDKDHTVTSDLAGVFDSGTMAPGRIYLHTFNTSGEFNYHCNLHPMAGKVIVR